MANVLITGANRGIGLALCEAYLRDGWQVHATCRHPEKAKTLKALEGNIEVHRLDVSDALQVASLARALRDQALDVVINNAGLLGGDSTFGKVDYDSWMQVFAVNAMAPLRVAEKFAAHLEAGEHKVLANISSVTGSIAENQSGGRYAYRSTKAALNMVGKTLANDFRERGITVLQFHPGWVRTDMGGADAAVSPEDSAAGICKVIADASLSQSGCFYRYDGQELPW